MSHTQIIILTIVLLLLIMLSGFFSAAETGLMAINRYRVRHKARLKKRYAMLILRLLKRPDRVLGLILIGNNFSNILASAIATLIAVHYWGDAGVIFSTILLTLVVLIFAEVAPKTIAVLYPERISRILVWPIFILLKVFYPLVWLINTMANSILYLFRIKVSPAAMEPLTREELRSVVYETTGKVPHQYQSMLLSILDLNKVTVREVMIPRHEIVGINIESDWDLIRQQITTCEFDWLPIYRENINQIVGVLHLRDLTHLLVEQHEINKELLMDLLQPVYFVPDTTSLNIQLLNFQRERKRLALVVDEYGEIQGLLTLVDILEEIVGEFTTTIAPVGRVIQKQPDGSFLVDGATTIREINRITEWTLPIKGPRTLNGLIIEYLEAIPRPGICVKIADYPIEIVHVARNRVKLARIFPPLLSKM